MNILIVVLLCCTDVDSTQRESPARVSQAALQHLSLVTLQDQVELLHKLFVASSHLFTHWLR